MGCGWLDDDSGFYCIEGNHQSPEGGDSDGDGIANGQDLCSGSPQGMPVWQQGEWLGCAEGQYRD